jgi:hypothetical protein
VRKLLGEKAFPRAAFETACATLFLLFVPTVFYEARNPLESGRELLEHFSEQIPEGTPVAIYGRKEPEVLYYLDRTDPPPVHLDYPDPTREEDPDLRKIDEFLRQPTAVFLVTSKGEYENLRNQFSSLSAVLLLKAEGRAGKEREYVLVGNR